MIKLVDLIQRIWKKEKRFVFEFLKNYSSSIKNVYKKYFKKFLI